MAQQAASEGFLCIGDAIYLLGEDQGVAHAEGFGDADSLGILKTNDKLAVSGTFGNLATFTVWQQITINAAQALKEYEESTGGATTRRSSRNAESIEAGLDQDAKKERARNRDEFQLVRGREVRYGAVVTLQHDGSGRYVATSKTSSDHDRSARKVVLSNDLSEDIYFRIMPQLGRVHSEGERIHDGDPVILESVANVGLRLHISSHEIRSHGQPWLEVLASIEPTGFKLQRFRSVQAEAAEAAVSAKPLLFGGQAVRLLHVEANAYVQGDCESNEVSLRRGDSASSNAIFQVEQEQPYNGSSFKWDSPIRLRHLGSARLLTLPASPFSGSRATAPTALGKTGDGENGTLFGLSPQYAELQSGAVRLGDHLRLRHVDSLGWLHCADPGSTAAEAPLLASVELSEADVYRFEIVDVEVMRNILYAKNLAEALATFLALPLSFDGAEVEAEHFARLRHVLTELVFFCSLSDNTDPMTREGLPQEANQSILCELLVMDRAMAIVQRVVPPLIEQRKRGGSGVTTLARTARLCQRLLRHILRKNPATCQYASQQPASFLEPLQAQMGYGILAAETLREIYVDNVALLEKIDSAQLATFFDLLKSSSPGLGRKARYIEFFMVLCTCAGKAVRVNQWLLADLLFTAENAKLLLDLSLDPETGQILVSGEPEYFPTFRAAGGGRVESLTLVEWLKAPPSLGATAEQVDAHREVRTYFTRTIELLNLLVIGRNRRNTMMLRKRLPYPLVEAVITSRELHEEQVERGEVERLRHPYMRICAAFAAIARNLYVDSYATVPLLRKGATVSVEEWEEHQQTDGSVGIGEQLELMTRVKMMRVWANVEEVEKSGKLSSRKTTKMKVDFDCFEVLQRQIYGFLSEHAAHQVATRVEMNGLILELLLLLHAMLQMGFLTAGIKTKDELEKEAREAAAAKFRRKGAPSRLSSMGSRGSIVAAQGSGFVPLVEEADDEVLDAPPPLAKGEQATVRHFIPVLLRVLDGTDDRMDEDDEGPGTDVREGEDQLRYHPWKTITQDTVCIMECKLWACRILQLVCTMRVDIRLSKLLRVYKDLWEPRGEGGLKELIGEEKRDERMRQSLAERVDTTMQILRIPQRYPISFLFKILFDCVNYEHTELAEAAMAMVVRHYEQKRVLSEYTSKVQLLVLPRMCRMYTLFEELLRPLTQYASRRRLIDDETQSPPLDESFLLSGARGTLALNSGAAQVLGQLTSWLYDDGLAPGARDASHATPLSATAGGESTDHTQFIYLKLIGKARVKPGSSEVNVIHLARCLQPGDASSVEEMMPAVGDELQLEGGMYRVAALTGVRTLELDRKFEWPSSPPELSSRRGSETVWLMQKRQIIRHDRDAQLMILNLQGGAIIEHAIQLLRLPFEYATIRLEDLNTRAVLRAVYRLLKAFCAKFPSGQAHLATSLPCFLPHCEADLVSMDISPMGCINAIFKDNHTICASVEMESVQQVVQLAVRTRAPRMLRFLSNLMEAKGTLIVSNQTLVLQALDTNESALLLFADPSGMEELKRLIASGDDVVNPRGRLVYHIEIVKLLALATRDKHTANQRWVAERLLLGALNSQLGMREAPAVLQAAYLELLRSVFLITAERKRGKDLLDADALEPIDKTVRQAITTFATELSSAGVVSKPPEGRPPGERKVRSRSETEFILFGSLLPAVRDLHTRFPDLLKEDDEDFATNKHTNVKLQDDLLKLAHAVDIHGGEHSDKHLQQIRDALVMLRGSVFADEILQKSLGRRVVSTPATGEGLRVPAYNSAAGMTLSIPMGKGVKAGATPLVEPASLPPPIEELHPQENLAEFVSHALPAKALEEEYDELVSLFRTDIKWHKGMRTRKLIQQLTPTTSSIDGDLSADELRLKKTCLRILSDLASDLGEGREAREMQVTLDGMGASAVALSMAACDNDDLCEAGLVLCAALLGQGNAAVQQTMLTLLSDPSLQEQAKPFDGSKSTFLASMRSRLKLGSKEISARKRFEEQQRALKDPKAIERETKALGAAAKKRYLDNLERPFSSRAKVLAVLRTLNFMCQGDHSALQEYLREQPGEPLNVDLVSEVYELFSSLSASGSLDGSNVEQLLMCLPTLSEMIQGSKTGGSMAALLGTKILEQLDSLLTAVQMPRAGRKTTSSGLTRKHVARLHKEVSVLFLSLIESETPSPGVVEEQMLRKVSLEKLAYLIQSGYESANRPMEVAGQGEEVVLTAREERELSSETASNVYMLLRYLLDFELKVAAEQASRATKGSQAPPEPRTLEVLQAKIRQQEGPSRYRVEPRVRQHFARLVGAVEVCSDAGVLRKRYFPIPHVCLKLLDGNEHSLPDAEQLKERSELVIWGLEGVKAEGGDKRVREVTSAANATPAMMHAMKKELLWSVDRTKRTTLLHDFVRGTADLHFEMTHLHGLERWAIWRWLSTHKKLAFESTFYVALLQNVVLLARYTFTGGSETYEHLEGLANQGMGGLQVLSCVLTFVAVSIQSGPLLLKRAGLYRDQFGESKHSRWDAWDEQRAQLLRRGRDAAKGSEGADRAQAVGWLEWIELWREYAALALQVPMVLLADMRLLTALLLLAAALLGLFVSPLWFTLHLVDIVNKSNDLQYVFRSVKNHGRSIAMTACFGIIIIYIYAAVGYGLLPRGAFREPVEPFGGGVNLERGSDAEPAGGDSEELLGSSFDGPASQDGLDRLDTSVGSSGRIRGRMLDDGGRGPWADEYCSTLLFCWLAAVNEGLRAGDIGVLMYNPDPTGDWGDYAKIMLYQFSFYSFVITVLLSIIFGIIVDSFSHLRIAEQENRKHMLGVCFICGADRLTLDTQGSGFERHIMVEHNMWVYVFMLIHIRERDPLDYNGWEAEVARKLNEDDYTFLPSNNAICLREYNERRTQEANTLREMVAAMESALAATAKQVAQLCEDAEARRAASKSH